MESASASIAAQRKAEHDARILKQIEQLKRGLSDNTRDTSPIETGTRAGSSLSRANLTARRSENANGRVLIPASPSKSQARAQRELLQKQREPRSKAPHKASTSLAGPSRSVNPAASSSITAENRQQPALSTSRTSALLNWASTIRLGQDEREKRDDMMLTAKTKQTSGFGQRPSEQAAPVGARSGSSGLERDERLALVEKLELGPRHFEPPFGDPNFEQLEPNSGIRLRSRAIPHARVQEHLDSRYYISPSLLYSIARPNSELGNVSKYRRNEAYDVPIEGDWILMGVLAEKSEMRVSTKGRRNLPFGQGGYEGGLGIDARDAPAAPGFEGDPEEAARWKGKSYGTDGKKYFSFKLIDMGVGVTETGSARGDAIINLMLFEADEDGRTGEHVRPEVKPAMERRYIGGSGGAFEKLWKEREGTVVAILNPQLMKPLSRQFVGRNNVITITPDSDDSVLLIGRALDFGQCEVQKRDGTRCTSFIDKRSGTTICDYHLSIGVQKQRNGRQEFASGTSGMGTELGPSSLNVHYNKHFGHSRKSKSKFKSKFDNPFDIDTERKTGLLLSGLASGKVTLPARFGIDDGLDGRPSHAYFSKGDGLLKSDPRSVNFDVSDQYGRGREGKERRKRKREEEEQMLWDLVAKREGGLGLGMGASGSRRARSEQDGAEEVEEGAGQMSGAGASVGAQALLDAQRLLAERQARRKQSLKEKNSKPTAKKRGVAPVQSDSDSESGSELPGGRPRATSGSQERTTSPNDDRAESQGTSSAKKRWSYGPDAIKLMGFDPLAGARGRTNQGSRKDSGAESKQRLLARHLQASALPAPRLRLPTDRRIKSNVRAPVTEAAKTNWDEGFSDDSDLDLCLGELGEELEKRVQRTKQPTPAVGEQEHQQGDSSDELEIV